jgi:hypothetical protein
MLLIIANLVHIIIFQAIENRITEAIVSTYCAPIVYSSTPAVFRPIVGVFYLSYNKNGITVFGTT